jgi:hypothetical protein
LRLGGLFCAMGNGTDRTRAAFYWRQKVGMSMVVRTVSFVVVLVSALATFAAPAQAAARVFGLVNGTKGTVQVVYKRFPSGTVLLHVGIPPGRTMLPEVRENTEIYVWIDRAGCPSWDHKTAKTGDRTFHILADCKIDATAGLPE